MLYPVILCGGAGSRLWPASRPDRPKPFIPLLGGASMFGETLRRAAALNSAASPIIVAGAAHVELIRAELAGCGLQGLIIVEPEGRDSAPAMTAAALVVLERDPAAVCLFLAADHLIPDQEAFSRTVDAGAAQAGQGGIVTLGLRPTEPSSAYGYIAPGVPVGDRGVRQVERFVEKPDEETARSLIEQGCLWNSGMFLTRADTLLSEVHRHAALVGSQCGQAVSEADRTGDLLLLGPSFRTAPRISIDYAVMEHCDQALVLPADFAWSDLGAWDAVHQALEVKDEAGNAIVGAGLVQEASDCLIYAEPGMTVAAKGVRNLAIIADRHGVLVCDLAAAPHIKKLVEAAPTPVSAPLPQPLEAEDPMASLSAWLDRSALPLWWALGADHERGGFHETLAADGRTPGHNRRMRVQARQTHVFARAGLAGWPGPWRQAVVHGLDELFGQYRRADGLYRTLIAPSGQTLDPAVRLYDQAFVLLAMASACRAGVRWASCRAEARALVGQIRAAFSHAPGGFREEGDMPYQSNAHMHLLEAALAWAELDDHRLWRDLAGEIVDLAIDRFMRGGEAPLGEVFSEDWSPAPGPAGRCVEPGHQFEWSWLMGEWARLSGDPRAEAARIRLFRYGEAGVDPVRGVALDEVDPDMRPVRTSARLWPQTERLRAAIALAGADPANAGPYLAVARQAAVAVRRYLDQPGAGLWLDRMDPSGGLALEPSPASSLYHLVSAIEAIRSARPAPAMADPEPVRANA